MTTPRKPTNVKCIVCIGLLRCVSLVLPSWLLECQHEHPTHSASVSTEPHVRRVWPAGVVRKALERRKVEEREESTEGTREEGGSKEETTAILTQHAFRTEHC
uniref:Secreted protein n=1 Tax=Ixodes ricinus TaxID=34613 RepID=A0A6B0UCT1_IXORI